MFTQIDLFILRNRLKLIPVLSTTHESFLVYKCLYNIVLSRKEYVRILNKYLFALKLEENISTKDLRSPGCNTNLQTISRNHSGQSL